ncbi:hypothetical protein C2S52_023418 [Perilla frutescens var. hirtella]|nr:hypothetical protein C2S52_023418 [Perilla frutescens var. hirtella]KAH6777327.1 hypothetical protein C2S51_008639 [Perilla frutescens var. frutescens]
MNFPSLLLLGIIWSAAWAQTCCSDEGSLLHHQVQQHINHNASLENRSNGITGPWPWKQHRYYNYKHRALKTAHGIVNIMGWGVLLPSGVIMARYLRESTNDWYNLHILSQLSGFLLGTLGWGLGISIKNEAKQHRMSTHGILGTIIFAFATLQPDEEHECRKYWVIYHNFVGYALLLLIIANIFQGISNHNAPNRWDLFYGAVLGVLGVIAIALEFLRWIHV